MTLASFFSTKIDVGTYVAPKYTGWSSAIIGCDGSMIQAGRNEGAKTCPPGAAQFGMSRVLRVIAKLSKDGAANVLHRKQT